LNLCSASTHRKKSGIHETVCPIHRSTRHTASTSLAPASLNDQTVRHILFPTSGNHQLLRFRANSVAAYTIRDLSIPSLHIILDSSPQTGSFTLTGRYTENSSAEGLRTYELMPQGNSILEYRRHSTKSRKVKGSFTDVIEFSFHFI
jgi:hypothetical protein